MRRLLVLGGVAAVGATLLVSVVHAQTPSPSRSPTSDPAGSPLVIECDITTNNKGYCSTDSDIQCCLPGETEKCGVKEGGCPPENEKPGACVPQPVFIGNECTIDKFFGQFVILAQWGVSFVVILGLLLLIWGGIQWITAGGRASKIEEGKRILTGTVVGIIVSFAAYVIVNFTIAAVTGTTRPSANPFAGPIATLFGNQTIDGDSIERPFSGDGQGTVEDLTNCRATWDNQCDNQIFCTDPGFSGGRVTTTQQQLNGKHCNCGTADGCFGKNTATCVRRFQIANSLEPTGMVDGRTADLIFDAGQYAASQDCVSGTLGAEVSQIVQKIPTPTIAALAGTSLATGCCVVKASISGSPPLFCSDNMSARTCQSLGENYIFKVGKSCAFDAATRNLCGFCYQKSGGDCSTSTDSCFGQTGRYWCESVANPGLCWAAGAMTGNSLCETNHLETLRTSL